MSSVGGCGGLSTDRKSGGKKYHTNVEREEDGLLQQFADDRDVVLMAFVGSYVPRRYGPSQFSRSTMSIDDEFSIEEALTQISKEYESTSRKLYLLVNSLGGHPSSALKIAMAIRRTFDEITVFVPHIAASGGTLLALTGDKIRMGMMSQLSPVDVQVVYKDTSVSTNAMLAAKDTLDNELSMKRVDELSYLERHLAESFDPAILEEFAGTAHMGATYLDIILKASKYDEQSRKKITKKLVFGFPVHEFVIHADLAKDIGIHVEDSNEDVEAWEVMREWFWRYIDQAEDKHFVRFAIPQKKGK